LLKGSSLVIVGLFFIVFTLPISLNVHSTEVRASKEDNLASELNVLLLYATTADLNLGNALAQEVNSSLETYNISKPTFTDILPISLDRFQAIWWFASSFPAISPVDLFNGSYTSLKSWFAAKKGFFLITEHVSILDMSIRDFVGIKGVYPYSYPLNASEANLELEINIDEPLLGVNKGSKVTLSSRAGFFIPKREENVIARVTIGDDFSGMTSGLVMPRDLGYFSALLSLSPSPNWLSIESFRVSRGLVVPSDISQAPPLDIVNILQAIARFSTSGEIPLSPDDDAFVDMSGDILSPVLVGLTGLLVLSLLFVGIKTGRIQRLIFGVFSGTVFLIAHVAYSPSKRRLDRRDLLANRLRAKIVDALYAKGPGGAHLRELQRELNCGISSLLWHLQTLDDFGIVQHSKFGGYHVFYLTELADGISPELAMTIRNETAKSLCRTMVSKPKKPLRLSDLAKAVGCHLETARYHLKKLEGAGVVTRIRDKSRTHYVLRPDLIPEVDRLVAT
jgi:predicted transcriptional regulator